MDALISHIVAMTRLIKLDLSAGGAVSTAGALLLAQGFIALTSLTHLSLQGSMDEYALGCNSDGGKNDDRGRVATTLSCGLVSLAPSLHVVSADPEMLPQPARVVALPGGCERLDITCLALDDAFVDASAAAAHVAFSAGQCV